MFGGKLTNYIGAALRSWVPPKEKGTVYVRGQEILPSFFTDSKNHPFYVHREMNEGHLSTCAFDARGREYNVEILGITQYPPGSSTLLTPKSAEKIAQQYVTAPPGVAHGIECLLGIRDAQVHSRKFTIWLRGETGQIVSAGGPVEPVPVTTNPCDEIYAPDSPKVTTPLIANNRQITEGPQDGSDD